MLTKTFLDQRSAELRLRADLLIDESFRLIQRMQQAVAEANAEIGDASELVKTDRSPSGDGGAIK